MKKSLILILLAFIVMQGCKKKPPTQPPQQQSEVPSDIHGAWVGTWKSNVINDTSQGIIHISLTQDSAQISGTVKFDSLSSVEYAFTGELSVSHGVTSITTFAYNTSDSSDKVTFSLSYESGDTMTGTYSFSSVNHGTYWAIKGTHLTEPGWNILTSLNENYNDADFSADGYLFIGTNTGLFVSKDQGYTISPVYSTSIYAVSAVDSLDIFAVSSNKVLKSTDGGQHFTDITPDSNFVGGSGRKIRFTDTNSGVVFDGTSSYTTNDGGNTWSYHNNVLPGFPDAVRFGSVTTGYVTGYIPGQNIGGFVAKTTDGGNSFSNLSLPQDDSLAEVYDIFVQGQNLWIVGKKYKQLGDTTHNLKILLKSTDGGNTWTKMQVPSNNPTSDEWLVSVAVSPDGSTILAGNGSSLIPAIYYKISGSSASADTLLSASSSIGLTRFLDNTDALSIISTGAVIYTFFYRGQ